MFEYNDSIIIIIIRSIQPELTGSILTCQHDFSAEWRTYYDHRSVKNKFKCQLMLFLKTREGPLWCGYDTSSRILSCQYWCS